MAAWAQPADSVKGKEKHKVKKSYLPTGVRVGTDLMALGWSYRDKSFKGWEMTLDTDLDRYYLQVEYGAWERTFFPDSGEYHNQGTYLRLGTDVNFLQNDPDRNLFFLGFRYARGVYSEKLLVSITDPIWGTYVKTYQADQVPSRWLELTGGLRVKMWKWIWMGYTARYKFALKTGDSPMLPHDVPGYGKTNKETYWGFNYQLFFRIPVRKPPSVPPKK